MIKCPNCNMAVSEFATTCPHCGKAIDKESIEKEIQKQKVQKIEKHQLRKLGKEKYIPLILTIACIIIRIILYMVYMISYDAILSMLDVIVGLLYILRNSTCLIIPLIISILFITKIYTSHKGYVIKNVQMVLSIFVISIGVLSNVISTQLLYDIFPMHVTIGRSDYYIWNLLPEMNIKWMMEIDMSIISLLLYTIIPLAIYVVSLILCIKMGKKQDVHSDEKDETTE